MVMQMQEQSPFCQYHYLHTANSTVPPARLTQLLRDVEWSLKRYVWYLRVVGPRGLGPRILATARLKTLARRRNNGFIRESYRVLNLQPGEWVEVRSAREIFATLDGYDKLNGLQFEPEMTKFCGKRLKVYKRLEKIILEGSGELRRIKNPTVLLEGVICEGTAHGGCDKSCFLYWREQWLKRVPITRASDSIQCPDLF
jgi:hypothetical protein